MADEVPDIQFTSPVQSAAGEVVNPYRSSEVEIAYLTDEIIVAEVVTIPPPPRPRIWTALAAGILTLPLAFVVSLVVALIALFSSLNMAQIRNPGEVQSWMNQFIVSKTGIVVMTLPVQLTFLGVAFLGAALSPVPFRERLKLVRGTMPLWAWPILALSAPGMGCLSSFLMSLFFEGSGEALEMLDKMFRGASGWFLVVLMGLVAVLPGLSEEGLFRGYVQSRLLQRMPVWAAIGISSLLFAVAHLDPLHVLAVFPLGVWLGIISWRCNSIWPSVLGHFLNNAISIVMTHYSDAKGFEFIIDGPTIVLLIVSGAAVVVSVPLLIAHRPASFV